MMLADILNALKSFARVVGFSGQFNGTKAFIAMAGKYFWPNHLRPVASGTTAAMTAARYVYVPFVVEHATTFAGAWCKNSGTGDSGKKIKIAAFYEKDTGGPGALAKNFGEVTLGATSALQNFASSWAAAPGRYYLGIVSDTAPTMYLMAAADSYTSAGFAPVNVAANSMGILAQVFTTTALHNIQAHHDYVAGTYANFPEATAVAPTASESAFNSTPFFGLYT